MDWLTAFRDVTLPGGNESDDLHSGTIRNTIIETGGGVYDAGGSGDGEIGSFGLTKKLRVTTAAMYDKLRALVGKRGFLWRGRQVSADVPLGAAFYLPFNADGARANLTANDGTEPMLESGSVVGFPDDGKFSWGAVSLTEGFTNKIVNPSFEVDVTGWTVSSSDSSATITRDTTRATAGDASMLLERNTATWYYVSHNTIAVADGESITFSTDVYAGADIVIIRLNNGTTILTETSVTPGSEWVRVTTTWTNSTGASVNVSPRIAVDAASSISAIYIDSVQATKSAHALPYRDGDMPGCSWGGTAHASTTVVTASRLEYDSDVLNADRGTIAAWVRVSYTDTVLRRLIYHPSGSSQITISLYPGAPNYRVRVGDTAVTIGTVDVGNWQHVALTWNNGTAAFYVNGALSGTTWSYFGAEVGSIPLSIFASNTLSNHASGEICDLLIAKSALTATEIAAIYNAGLPLSQARIQRGIEARCVDLQATRRFDEPSHTDVALDFATIGRAWRGEVRQIVNQTLAANGNLTLTNNGDVTCKNLVVTIIATGAATVTLATGGFSMTVSATAANDELVIDCGAHTVRKNGADDYANAAFGGSNTTADWLPLAVGDNTLAVTLSGSEVEIIAQWYDTYR